MNRLVYYLVKGICTFLAYLPMRVLHFCSDLTYPFVFYIIRYRREVVYTNLKNAFPEKSDQEINTIAQKFYRHFCDMLFEMVKLFHISSAEIKERMHYLQPELLENEFKKNKHVLVVLGHYNNWEWGTGLNLSGPHQFTSIYKPLSSKSMDDILIGLRSQFGSEVVAMRQTARVLTQNIRQGKLTQLNFISDQSPMKDEIQFWTKFLNQDTPVYLGVEKLAIKFKQPVFYASMQKVKRGYYEVELRKLCDDASLLKPYELTELHTRLLEKDILRQPECWLWSHRRWKIKKETI